MAFTFAAQPWALCLLCALCLLAEAQDPVGCGGFVRLPAGAKAPNYSRMRIHLHNEQDNLRFVSDISPNGAYSVPVYERGLHKIRLSMPDGWSFEPEHHSVNVLGQESCQKDFDFALVGFSVSGSVVTRGLSTGPPDVRLALVDRASGERLLGNATDAEGKFAFSRVPPGRYTVKAEQAHGIVFLKPQVDLEVTNDNAAADSGLVVKGFTLSAGVTGMGAGAHVYLYSKLLQSPEGIGCVKGAHPEFRSPLPEQPLCHVETDAEGLAKFSDVPGGEFTLVPFHPDHSVQPEQLSLRVRHSDLALGGVFAMTGVVLRGVAHAFDGSPIARAEVRLAGADTAVETDAAGEFRLRSEQLQAPWTLQVSYPDLHFDAVTTEVLNVGRLRPSKFRVCGSVMGLGVRQVASDKGPDVATEQDGTFCFLLPPGKQMLRCGRILHEIDVSGPVKDLLLKERRVTVSGQVAGCFGDCPAELRVSLTGEESATSAVAPDGTFALPNVLPGAYTASVEGGDVLCWESRQLTVSDVDQPLKFRIVGAKASVTSSHELRLRYNSSDSGESQLPVPQGKTDLCLVGRPPYALLAESCHRLRQTRFRVEKPGDSVEFVADAFAVQVDVEYQEGASERLRLSVTADGETSEHKVGPDAASVRLFHVAGAQLQARLLANESVLEPDSLALAVVDPDSCEPQRLRFVVRRGRRVFGVVEPALPGVEVDVMHEDRVLQTLGLRQDGSFRSAPLDASLSFAVRARLTGYRFVEERSAKGFKLLAQQLAGVHVQAGLPSVLVSMSGDSARFHQTTDQSGLAVFSDLLPGRYYVRAMVKEFRFEPAISEVQVQEGRVTTIALRPVRTGYSAYGRVVSLSDSPFADAVVTADADASCEQGGQESADTDGEGEFRLRGLNAGCRYTIAVQPNSQIDRTLPPLLELTVPQEDTRGLVFYGVPRPQHTELFVTVDADSDLRQSLFLTVHPERNPARVIDSCELSDHIIMYSSLVPNDGQAYQVSLMSRLSRQLYAFDTAERRFVSNGSAVTLHFAFDARRRFTEREVSTASFLVIPLTALVIFLTHKRDLLAPLIGIAISSLLELLASRFRQSPASSPKHKAGGQDPLSGVPKELLEPSKPSGQRQLYYRRRKQPGGS